VGGSPALDFLNSIASPVDVPVEWLSSGEDLLDWLAQAGLVAPDVLGHMRETAGPGELDGVAAQARALRDWFRLFVAAHMGKRLTPASLRELEPLNRLLARDEVYGQVVGRIGARIRRRQALAVGGQPAAALGEDHGRPADDSRFQAGQGLRVARLLPAVRRHDQRAHAPLVQHGRVREQGETGRVSRTLGPAPAANLMGHRRRSAAMTQPPQWFTRKP
jgi:hypothetical protein